MYKYLLLAVPVLSIVSSVTATYADESTTPVVTATATSSISADRLSFQEKARQLREKNKQLHTVSKDARKDFRTENKDVIKENRKSLTEEQKIEIQKAHEDRKSYIHSLSGMTVEQKAQYMSGMENKIRHEIELKYQNNTSALATRMAVYQKNAERRLEMMANQLEIRSSRGTLRISEVDAMITKITAELPNLSTEKKTKLAKKIDEKITKIQANKRLPDTTKTEIITKLTSLRNEVVK
jgi:hypothetical protein